MNASALAFALVAGAVAAFNPCGFALLPAYLGLLALPAAGGRPGLGRPVRFAAGMTLGFVAVFGAVGLALVPLAVSIERYLPVVTVVIGVLLVGVGAWLVAGRHLALPGLAGWGTAPTAGWWSQVGYGVSFALASLSCTIAPFLAVIAGSLAAGGPVGIITALAAYALGMGTVVLTLALAVAAARTSMVRGMRRAGAMISRGSGALLVVAGAYVAWYGWFEIRVLAGAATTDPIISAAVPVQAAFARWVAGLGPGVLLTAGAASVSAAVAVVVASRTRAWWRTGRFIRKPPSRATGARQPSGPAALHRAGRGRDSTPRKAAVRTSGVETSPCAATGPLPDDPRGTGRAPA